jgi:hypothetical protein
MVSVLTLGCSVARFAKAATSTLFLLSFQESVRTHNED